MKDISKINNLIDIDEDEGLDIEIQSKKYLLTWDRLDLAFDLFYSDLINKNKELAERTYAENIIAKSELQIDYIRPKDIIFDYKFYQKRSVDETILDNVVTKFIEYASNTYIGFLWPAGGVFKDEVHSMFKKVVYKKDIKLTPTGAFNILQELYKSVDWLGNKGNKYKGTKEKLVKCFPNFESFTIIVFQSDSFREVIKTKKGIRDICNVDFDSIHTTDNREEALRISRLVFNENGRHFLNYSNPHEFEFLNKKIQLIRDSLAKDQLDQNKIVLDYDMTLALYGIKDFDRVRYLDETKESLIYDPSYYFYYGNIKFISFEKLYDMKSNSNKYKDKEDLILMDNLINNTAIDYKTTKLDERIMYMKIKYKFMVINLIKYTFRKIGLFNIAKAVYHKLKTTKIE